MTVPEFGPVELACVKRLLAMQREVLIRSFQEHGECGQCPYRKFYAEILQLYINHKKGKRSYVRY